VRLVPRALRLQRKLLRLQSRRLFHDDNLTPMSLIDDAGELFSLGRRITFGVAGESKRPAHAYGRIWRKKTLAKGKVRMR
jgi:hypothetical protein